MDEYTNGTLAGKLHYNIETLLALSTDYTIAMPK